MEAVGQLDEDDADVLGHGHQHLAEALGVEAFGVGCAEAVGAGRTVVNAGELGYAVHQAGHIGAEPFFQVLHGDAAVLHHVVEEGGLDGIGVQVEVGQDGGGGQGMDDVGVAGEAFLPVVAAGGEVVGGADGVNLLRIVHVFGNAGD